MWGAAYLLLPSAPSRDRRAAAASAAPSVQTQLAGLQRLLLTNPGLPSSCRVEGPTSEQYTRTVHRVGCAPECRCARCADWSGPACSAWSTHRRRAQLLVSDKPGCGGWRYAEEQGIPTAYYNPRDSASQSAELLVDSMHAAGITFAVLAGYLKASH